MIASKYVALSYGVKEINNDVPLDVIVGVKLISEQQATMKFIKNNMNLIEFHQEHL